MSADGAVMKNPQGEILTDQLLVAFGALLQCFARYEITIERAIASILQTDVSNVAILIRHLDLMDKRAALLALLKSHSIPDDRWERIFAHLTVPASNIGLRNHIIHSTWMASPEPKSIQPNWILQLPPEIEPISSGQKFGDSSSYTLEMLTDTADNLTRSHERFVECLVEYDLIRLQS
ncbi:MAG: hypothetical protein KGL35_11280 [Bradyrhizobium sp.]|nr:hypothetical protein [Pseudomonadota bacterium]MDE2469298.1 hypothetical protein [Bradyrhizobium sp.]